MYFSIHFVHSELFSSRFLHVSDKKVITSPSGMCFRLHELIQQRITPWWGCLCCCRDWQVVSMHWAASTVSDPVCGLIHRKCQVAAGNASGREKEANIWCSCKVCLQGEIVSSMWNLYIMRVRRFGSKKHYPRFKGRLPPPESCLIEIPRMCISCDHLSTTLPNCSCFYLHNKFSNKINNLKGN